MIVYPEAVLRSAQLPQAFDTAFAYLGWFMAKMDLQRFSERHSDVGIQSAKVPMGITSEFDRECHMAIIWL